jgi:hypothetical protein
MRVGMLDNGDTTSDSYAVARHQSPLLFSPGVPFLAPAGLRHWNEIASTLFKDEVYVPLLDGFFAALIAAPDVVMPSEYYTRRSSAARCRTHASSAASTKPMKFWD